MRILVIDDSRAIRGILRRMLTEIGAEVAEAEHGGNALEVCAASAPFDLALVDWNMPEVDGLTFVRTVRANPRYAGMKLMMVTTETEVHQVETALAAGANEYLMKPFGKDEVLGKLQLLGLG